MQNLSYLGAAPDSLHPSTHHPPEAGQRVSRPVDSGQWTVDSVDIWDTVVDRDS